MTSPGLSAPASIVIGTASVSGVGTAIRSSRASRLPFLDFLRAAASHLIVLHHCHFHGPLAEHAYPAAPIILEWLMRYARMAVQVFFVLGGYFTVRSLSRGKLLDARSVGAIVWQRYRRIGVPYLATLVIAIFANALARQWMTHEAISAPPTVGQLLAHAAFLHDILGYQALTAGIWYLARDFQLFLLEPRQSKDPHLANHTPQSPPKFTVAHSDATRLPNGSSRGTVAPAQCIADTVSHPKKTQTETPVRHMNFAIHNACVAGSCPLSPGDCGKPGTSGSRKSLYIPTNPGRNSFWGDEAEQ